MIVAPHPSEVIASEVVPSVRKIESAPAQSLQEVQQAVGGKPVYCKAKDIT